MRLEAGRIVIEPFQTLEYGLESLLEASTADQFALEGRGSEMARPIPGGP